MSTETYEATIQGLKDIHDDENPCKILAISHLRR
jgi:hypothetical protein